MMRDQADKLREMIDSLKPKELEVSTYEENVSFENKCRVITVTSGKGGVGKTSISVNLAVKLGEMGYRVVVFDADFGLANVDILFGISPKYNLIDVINSNKTIYDIITDGTKNVKFISGGSGLVEMTKLKKWQLEMVIKKISGLDVIADIVIVDTGAGVAESVRSFVFASDEVVLVTSPEPTAIMDAYAMVKAISTKDKSTVVKLIINRAKNMKESINASKKLCTATEKFLGIKLYPLGHLLLDETVTKAVKEQCPFVQSYSKSQPALQIEQIADRLINNTNGEVDKIKKYSGIKGFLNRVSNIINV